MYAPPSGSDAVLTRKPLSCPRSLPQRNSLIRTISIGPGGIHRAQVDRVFMSGGVPHVLVAGMEIPVSEIEVIRGPVHR